MAEIRRIALLGAGHGGCAAAVDLTQRGFEVRLHSRSEARLAPLRDGITATGARTGTVRPALLTTDLAKAVDDADLVVLVVPASAHEAYARALASLLRPDVPVLLNPGHTGGSLDVAHALAAAGGAVPPIAETVTLTYICRMEGPATVAIYRETSRLRFAALPASRTTELADRIAPLFPNIAPVASVLETGLMNINAIIHPPGVLMNAGWTELTGGDFLFYKEAITPSVARVIEAVDGERLALAAALGVDVPAFIDYFCAAGLTSEAARQTRSIYRAMQESAPNRTIRAPASLVHRYVDEDVGYGLVPMSELARLAGVLTPTMDALVRLASTARGVDFRSAGLTLARMGLAGVSTSDLSRRVRDGYSRRGA